MTKNEEMEISEQQKSVENICWLKFEITGENEFL